MPLSSLPLCPHSTFLALLLFGPVSVCLGGYLPVLFFVQVPNSLVPWLLGPHQPFFVKHSKFMGIYPACNCTSLND